MYMNDGNKTKINLRNKSVFITGVAGFIGSNLAKRLLSTVEGVKVVGLDNMNHYYDVRLKEARLNELEQFDNFSFVKGNLADKAVIESIFEQYKPEIVVNLGAQAGVRYSITNPDAYVEANLIGFYNILEACRHSYDEGHTPVEHLVYASSSSVYGSNKKVPYSTDDKVDNPVSLYAATKKSNELMAHAVCLEGSLKLKEISYIHSEAYAAGELKHGTISLIERGTLVIGVLTQSELYEKTISNMLECKSRGAYLMGLTTYGKYEIEDQVNFTVYVPKVDEHFVGSLAVIPLQLLGYYVSVAKGLDVDKPRNLAKSVTVE
mgnify:CR=1 FL=1